MVTKINIFMMDIEMFNAVENPRKLSTFNVICSKTKSAGAELCIAKNFLVLAAMLVFLKRLLNDGRCMRIF